MRRGPGLHAFKGQSHFLASANGHPSRPDQNPNGTQPPSSEPKRRRGLNMWLLGRDDIWMVHSPLMSETERWRGSNMWLLGQHFWIPRAPSWFLHVVILSLIARLCPPCGCLWRIWWYIVLIRRSICSPSSNSTRSLELICLSTCSACCPCFCC